MSKKALTPLATLVISYETGVILHDSYELLENAFGRVYMIDIRVLKGLNSFFSFEFR